jgi:paraquat-inducible protein B
LTDTRPPVERTRAEVRRGWWPGWIWAIPVAAVLLVGWWLFRTLATGGETVTIQFDDVHGMKADDTKVELRGMNVGQVKELKLTGGGVVATVHIDEGATPFLRSGTRFWLRGAEPSLSDLSSLAAVLSGPTVIMDPGSGDKRTDFVGLAYAPVGTGQPKIYTVSLNGAVGDLKAGDPVKLRAFTVGEIKDVGFHFDVKTGHIATPITLALYPGLFHMQNTLAPADPLTLDAAVTALIREGLRARLARDPPLVGSPRLTLEFVGGQSDVGLSMVDGIPQIPAADGGDSGSVLDKVNRLPLEQIAQNVLEITEHVDALVGSGELTHAVGQFDSMVSELRTTVASTGPSIADLVRTLNRTADELQRAVRRVERTAHATEHAANAANEILGGTPSQNDARTAVRELTEAARSVRELADFLERHPEALIRGRGGAE